MNHPLSVLFVWTVSIFAGYVSWRITTPESFGGAVVFVLLWFALAYVFRGIAALIIIFVGDNS